MQRIMLGTRMRALSKEQVMATMTVEKAYRTFQRMNHSRFGEPVVSLIEQKFKHTSTGELVSTGQALDKTRDLLNEVMYESTMKKELEEIRCTEFENRQFALLKQTENDIAVFNSQAAAAREKVMHARGEVHNLELIKVPTNRKELTDLQQSCKLQEVALKSQLRVVTQDIEVMKGVLKMVCADDASKPFASAVQLGAAGAGGGAAIVRCTSCQTGQPAALLRHGAVQPMLASVQSEAAKNAIQENLLHEFDDHVSLEPDSVQPVVLAQEEVKIFREIDEHMRMVSNGTHALVLAQQEVSRQTAHLPSACDESLLGDNGNGYRGCQMETLSGKRCQRWSVQTPNTHAATADSKPDAGLGEHNYCRNPTGLDTIWCVTEDPNVPWEYCKPRPGLEVPGPVATHDCVQSKKCTLGTPSCTKLRDRFMTIMGGLQDKKEEFADGLDQLEDDCKAKTESYGTLIGELEGELSEHTTAMALGIKDNTEAQGQTMLSTQKYKDLSQEYHKTMEQCCDNKNEFLSEVCALTKIRGELYRLQNLDPQMSDCEVTDWKEEECSASCDGGKQTLTRSIIVQPVDGMMCAPMSMERSCNLDGCPVDCKVGDWSLWSACTAECGGGVRTRDRMKTQDPQNGGEPCLEMQDSDQCNNEACSADCIMADWGEWSLCSKVCQKGHRERTREVVTPKHGLGSCDEWDSETRLGFEECNSFSCRELLPPGRHTLRCTAMTDIVIVLDGSGSLGEYGWKKTKSLATKLVAAMQGGEHGVHVALLLYSGPDKWSDYEACVGSDPNARPEPKTCGIQWISHMTGDLAAVTKSVQKMEWPARTTFTSMALAEANAELISGRPDALSTVVVITDAKPVSPLKTGHAAEQLKQAARLVWIPVGQTAEKEIADNKQWASVPWQDNVIDIANYHVLDTPHILNNIIGGLCNSAA